MPCPLFRDFLGAWSKCPAGPFHLAENRGLSRNFVPLRAYLRLKAEFLWATRPTGSQMEGPQIHSRDLILTLSHFVSKEKFDLRSTVSRIPCPRRSGRGVHSSSPAEAELPAGAGCGATRDRWAGRPAPYLALHRIGFVLRPRSPGEPVGPYPTFSPLPGPRSGTGRFVFCDTFRHAGLNRRALPFGRNPALRCPDFPLPRRGGEANARASKIEEAGCPGASDLATTKKPPPRRSQYSDAAAAGLEEPAARRPSVFALRATPRHAWFNFCWKWSTQEIRLPKSDGLLAAIREFEG